VQAENARLPTGNAKPAWTGADMRKATPQTRASPFIQPLIELHRKEGPSQRRHARAARGLVKDQIKNDEYDQRNAKQPAE